MSSNDVMRAAGKLFSARTINALLGFAAITFFSREIGAAALGVYFLFEALVSVLSIPSDFGINHGVQKRLSEREGGTRVLGTAAALKLVPLLFVSVCSLLARPVINSYVGIQVTVLLILGLTVRQYADLAIAALCGELRVGETATLAIVRNGTWLVVGGGLALEGLGARAPIYGMILGWLLSGLGGLYKLSTPVGRPSRALAGSLLEFSKYSFVSSVGGYLYNWMDVVFIGYFIGPAAVGAYEVAWRVTEFVMIAGRSVAASLFPQVSEWDASGERDRIEEMLPAAISMSLVLVVPSFFGVVLFGEEILGFVFGSEYTVAALALVILMGEKVVQAVHHITGSSLQAIDRPDLAAKASVVSIVVNLILNAILVVRFGIVGAAIATTVAFVLNSVLHIWFVRRLIRIRWPYHVLAWYVVSGVVMYAGLLVVSRISPVGSFPKLVVYVAFGAIIYFAVIASNPSLRSRIVVYVREETI